MTRLHNPEVPVEKRADAPSLLGTGRLREIGLAQSGRFFEVGVEALRRGRVRFRAVGSHNPAALVTKG